MPNPGGEIVVLGEAIGSYGVRGWLKVRPYTGSTAALLAHPAWWLKPARGSQWREYPLADGREHSGLLVVQLEGVDTREAASALKGFEVGVPRASLPAAGENEIYWSDLDGMSVTNREGVLLGVVRGVTEHGAHPLLRVARPAGSPGAERLIPYVPAIVQGVDLRARTIEVDWGEDYY